MIQSQKNSLYITLGVLYLLFVGTLARFHDLAWHFSHADDMGVAKTILDAIQGGQNPFFEVSHKWTYAPLQFFVTPLLINLDQSYRELLFWGRFPSFIASVASLICVPLFYHFWNTKKDLQALLALTLMVCSWEHLIYAKQMHNYALTGLGIILILCLWGYLLNPERLNAKNAMVVSVSLALMASMSYQLLWFFPAFFGSLFLHHLFQKKGIVKPTLFFLITGILLIALVFPLYWFFLKKMLSVSHAGMTWNKGPNDEFVFSLVGKSGLQALKYSLQYYLSNFLLVLQNNLAFMSPQSRLLVPIVYYGFGFFYMIGLLKFVLSKDKHDRAMLFFLIATALSWIVLITFHKTTLAPTRHNLVLLPLMAIVLARGMHFSCEQMASWISRDKVYDKIMISIVGLIVLIWMANLPAFFADRKDPFRESEILRLIETYQPDTIITLDHTVNIGQMKSVRDAYHYYAPGYIMGHEVIAKEKPAYQTILWISHRTHLNATEWNRMLMEKINPYLQIRNMILKSKGKATLPFLQIPFSRYEVLYREEIYSTVEVDYSTRTENGTNALFIYVLKQKT